VKRFASDSRSRLLKGLGASDERGRVDDIVAVLPPLLAVAGSARLIARHLNPPDFEKVMEAAGPPDQALQAVRSRLAGWPEEFASVQTSLEPPAMQRWRLSRDYARYSKAMVT